MRFKLLSVAVALVALWVAPSAFASGSGGPGGAQIGAQNAGTNQGALGVAASYQNAVNANVPVSIAGGNIYSNGPSSATQNPTSTATTTVGNTAKTDQNQRQNQNIDGGASCKAGCGGAGGFQAGVQNAQTNQLAGGAASSNQNAVNANVPVSIAGGNVTSGPSSATQNANSNATTNVTNDAETHQHQSLNQNIGGSGCIAGCGGAGGFQVGVQNAKTNQGALGAAVSKQNAVNANVPVSIAGGNVSSGPSSATQNATSNATANVSNDSTTDQHQSQTQNIGGGSCKLGCGGAGGFQAGIQNAETNQLAVGLSKSDQNAVNANVPVNIAGHDVSAGPSSANQTANSSATTNVSNKANTGQDQLLCQNIGTSSSGSGCDKKGRDGVILGSRDSLDGKDGCYAGCGGAGGFQAGLQNAETNQLALGGAVSKQNAVNSNTPVSIAGGNVSSGPSSATQNATSNATTNVSNDATTDQRQGLCQNIGSDSSGCGGRVIIIRDGNDSSRDGKDGCYAGCGGPGGFQLGVQNSKTNQGALGLAFSNQNAVNGNAPVSIAGRNIYGDKGSSSATQNATSNATANVSNTSETDQHQGLTQNIGGSGCKLGCGGAGGFQVGLQNAETNQWAVGLAFSNQNAVNSNTPHSTAGGNIYGGPSSATQTPTSTGTSTTGNTAQTGQGQWLNQLLGPSAAPTLSTSTGKTPYSASSRTPAKVTPLKTGTSSGSKTTPGVSAEKTAKTLSGVKTSAMLPFAGKSLRGALLAALGLLLIGTALRRAGRPGRPEDNGEVDTL
ncbi:MAG TPA: hypothetical protein VLU96_10465 [Gaiellaceae bacterium]|nr:hypothetical protein [Gaiellaceae bacterium]